MTLPAAVKRLVLRLYPKAFRGGEYDPKKYWTHFGLIYREKYHRRFLRGLKKGSDRNVELMTTCVGKLGVKSVLDVGCGYGLFLKALSERHPELRLSGCDVSPTQVEETRKFLGEQSGIDVRESDNFRLPFEDKAFDLSYTVVVCICIPAEKIEDFLREIVRVTRSYCLFLENRRGYSGWSYHEHDYPALFTRLGLPHVVVKDVVHDERPGRLYLVQVDPTAKTWTAEDLRGA